MVKNENKYNGLILLGVVVSSFLFFLFFYPYHLFLKEQIQLFLFTPGYFFSYFGKPAWLAAYMGDFLTQFFYLRGGGAVVLSLVFGFVWLLCSLVIKRITGSSKPGFWALFPVGADWALHCNTLHSVSVSVGFILVLCIFLIYSSLSKRWVSYVVLALFTFSGYWLAGGAFLIFPFLVVARDFGKRNPEWLKWLVVLAVVFSIPPILRHHYLLTQIQTFTFPAFGKQSLLLPVILLPTVVCAFLLKNIEQAHPRIIPVGVPFAFLLLLAAGITNNANFNFEKILSLDGETYFRNPDRVIQLAKKYDLKNNQAACFTNMALAQKGLLPEDLLDFYQPFSFGLIPPVTPEQNWQSIFVSNEVFYLIGDMNMAQHSAMLGNIFSPYQRSSRMLRRLAEINMSTGDTAAATKYLRILSKTLFHWKWAESRLKMLQSTGPNNWLTRKRSLVANADMLRKSTDYLSSLQFLVGQNPDNVVALDYLLCYLLLNKDVKLFRENYDRYYLNFNRKAPKVYAEALLIPLFASGASQQEVMKYNIDAEIVNRFAEYTRLFDQTSGDINALNKHFAKSYWFYYHFAQLKTN